jgi:peptidoglycan/xylan/chitin deacetylase (PgdA/CDA1 family)
MLRVLTYHRVAPITSQPRLDPRNISAVPAEFWRQMRYLKKSWEVVPLEAVVQAARGAERLPSRAVLVTFDDGYRDFLDHAWPVLEALGLPATMFVPTGFPGRPARSFWSDRLWRAFTQAPLQLFQLPEVGPLQLTTPAEREASLRRFQRHLKSIPHREATALLHRVCFELGEEEEPRADVLSWEQQRDLAARGLAICPHSRSHALLTRLSPEMAGAEIAGSLEDLRRELGEVQPVFCYPNGSHDDAVVDAAASAGIRLAFTTQDGHNDSVTADPLRLRRTNITRRTTVSLLGLRLTRWGAMIDRFRHRRRAS